jgi:hypothetical protein
MIQLTWKLKVVLLWLLLVANYLALMLIEATNGVIVFPSNDNTSQYVIAIFNFVPCVMAWLSLVLKPAASRWANMLVAVPFFLLKLLGVIGIPFPGTPGLVLNEAMAMVIAALIVWYSWKIPGKDSDGASTG